MSTTPHDVSTGPAWLVSLIRASASGAGPDRLRPELSGVPAAATDDRELLARAAVAIGAGQHALVLARRRAGTRRVAGRPLIEFQSTGHRLAAASARVALARAALFEAGRCEEEGGAGHQAPACAALAASAAFNAAQVLTQAFGAAGTSDPAATAAFEACQRAASAAGPPTQLWVQAGRRRLQL